MSPGLSTCATRRTSSSWRSRAAASSSGVPVVLSPVTIDHYSYEAAELLRDAAAPWKVLRRIRNSGAIVDSPNPMLTEVRPVPNLEVDVIDASFGALEDERERAYLNNPPTSFVLPAEAVDRLRAGAGTTWHNEETGQ
jgi:NTE family protein